MDNFDLKKYLAEGRLYENALAQKLRDEAKQPDSKVGASIFNKYAKKIENADKADYKKIIKAMESELISKHPNTFSGEDDIPGSFLSEGRLLKEEVDVLGNEFLQDIQDTMKLYYKMDVDMDDIKDWVNMYYIDYNSEYDDEEDKKELVFDTAEREDFYMHLNPDAESTFPSLAEGKLMDNFDLKKYLAEGRLFKENQDHSDEEDLDLHPDYDKGGKYYSEEGAEAFRIQPFKVNDIGYTKDQAVRQGKYIVGLEGEELKKFISSYMDAWKEDVGDTPKGKTFK